MAGYNGKLLLGKRLPQLMMCDIMIVSYKIITVIRMLIVHTYVLPNIIILSIFCI